MIYYLLLLSIHVHIIYVHTVLLWNSPTASCVTTMQRKAWADPDLNIRWMRHTFKRAVEMSDAVEKKPGLHLVRHQPAKDTPSMYIYTNLLDSNMIHNTDYSCV
jgi:hypothetical protein